MGITTFTGSKGGVGTTVTTVIAAITYAKAHPDEQVVIVDCQEDIAGVVGCVGSEMEILPNLRITTPLAVAHERARERTPIDPEKHPMLAKIGGWQTSSVFALAETCEVFVDCGRYTINPPYDDPRMAMWEKADRRVLVVRNDYLSLRSAFRSDDDGQKNADQMATAVVCIVDPERSLSVRDVRDVLSKPVIEIPADPTVARAVDAGVLTVRHPHVLDGFADRLTTTFA